MKSFEDAVKSFLGTETQVFEECSLQAIGVAARSNLTVQEYLGNLVRSMSLQKMTQFQLGMSIALTSLCMGVRIGQETMAKEELGLPVEGSVLEQALKRVGLPEQFPEGEVRALKESEAAIVFLSRLAVTIFGGVDKIGDKAARDVFEVAIIAMGAGLGTGRVVAQLESEAAVMEVIVQ